MRRIYLSGPISNDPNYRRNFRSAQEILENMGHKDIVNPAELCKVVNAESFDYEQIMNICLNLLENCDTILFLPGWKESHGCGREWGVGRANGFAMMEFEDYINMARGKKNES